MNHFSDKELACPCCGLNYTLPELRYALEEIRFRVSAQLGKDTPVHVDSGYRCPKHNKAVGGALNSQHIKGIAADIRVDGLNERELLALVSVVPGVHGIGRDDFRHFVHVDLRPVPASWCYDSHGRECRWYE